MFTNIIYIDVLICLLITLVALVLLALLTALICFLKVFYSPKRKPYGENEFPMPPGEIYAPFKEAMVGWMKAYRQLPHEDFEITSYDGLRLVGKYYEYEKGAPVELLFHGYRGNAERDVSAGIERCFSMKRNVLLVDQRSAGRSEGHVITFGIREKRDCLAWINFAVKHFGKDTKIILTGVSMGAATVMMAAGEVLPENVACVLADCGYTSAEEIIKKVISDMHLPPEPIYPIIKLGARLFGGFDLGEDSPIEAMKRATVPVIFIHGDTDSFVPCEMSETLYEACGSKHKRLVKIAGAGHGIAFPVDKELYLNSLNEFADECGFLSAK